MPLTEDERANLLARYELWGVDRVRADLEREDRALFANPEVTEIAEAWIAAKESAGRGGKARNVVFLLAVAAVAVVVLMGFAG